MAKKEDTTAKKENESMMGKAYRYMDSFHNVEPDRPPSSIGCLLTVLMVPVVLIYIVVWVVQHEGQPPVESMVIDWSVSKGPFPMKVSCAEASCWMWISGCTSGSSDQCIAMSSGESRTIEMCYSNAAREGLHMWWSSPNGTDPTTAGVKIYSQALNMEMNQLVEPGRSSMTYVKTHDTTQEESDYNHLRHEWFVMYLSSQALEPAHQGCQNVAAANAEMAQVVMRPEFYDKKIEKMDLWVSVIGEAGGAFGLAQTAFFALYLLLWYTQYGAYKLEEKLEETVHHHMHSAEAAADLEAAKKSFPESKAASEDLFGLHIARANL